MKVCQQCGETFIVGGILVMPSDDEPRGEVCLRCAFYNVKKEGYKTDNVMHIKPKEKEEEEEKPDDYNDLLF